MRNVCDVIKESVVIKSNVAHTHFLRINKKNILYFLMVAAFKQRDHFFFCSETKNLNVFTCKNNKKKKDFKKWIRFFSSILFWCFFFVVVFVRLVGNYVTVYVNERFGLFKIQNYSKKYFDQSKIVCLVSNNKSILFIFPEAFTNDVFTATESSY